MSRQQKTRPANTNRPHRGILHLVKGHSSLGLIHVRLYSALLIIAMLFALSALLPHVATKPGRAVAQPAVVSETLPILATTIVRPDANTPRLPEVIVRASAVERSQAIVANEAIIAQAVSAPPTRATTATSIHSVDAHPQSLSQARWDIPYYSFGRAPARADKE
ncbi:MAG: hypothetical protein ABI451_10510 [Dokdonella sp.]